MKRAPLQEASQINHLSTLAPPIRPNEPSVFPARPPTLHDPHNPGLLQEVQQAKLRDVEGVLRGHGRVTAGPYTLIPRIRAQTFWRHE